MLRCEILGDDRAHGMGLDHGRLDVEGLGNARDGGGEEGDRGVIDDSRPARSGKVGSHDAASGEGCHLRLKGVGGAAQSVDADDRIAFASDLDGHAFDHA